MPARCTYLTASLCGFSTHCSPQRLNSQGLDPGCQQQQGSGQLQWLWKLGQQQLLAVIHRPPLSGHWGLVPWPPTTHYATFPLFSNGSTLQTRVLPAPSFRLLFPAGCNGASTPLLKRRESESSRLTPGLCKDCWEVRGSEKSSCPPHSEPQKQKLQGPRPWFIGKKMMVGWHKGVWLRALWSQNQSWDLSLAFASLREGCPGCRSWRKTSSNPALKLSSFCCTFIYIAG